MSDDLTQHMADVAPEESKLQRAPWARAREGRFKADEMNGKMERNKAKRRNHSMVMVSQASMLRFNVGASSQRKVFYDIKKSQPLIPIPLKILSTRSSAMHWVS